VTKHFCTYFDSKYIVKGITMYFSLLKHETDFKLWILCFDEYTHELLSRMKLASVTLVHLKDFEDKELLKAKKTRKLFEYYWTCTPSLPLYILKTQQNVDAITYLDADLYFFSNTDKIFSECKASSILITEHRYSYNREKKEKVNGIYNVQYLTFKRDCSGIKALKWWRERCIEWCYYIPEGNKMGDQKYLDDWKTRFEGVCVSQNIGAGLAPWNISRYKIRKKSEDVYVNGKKLIFYHFHSLNILKKGYIYLSMYKLRKTDKTIIYEPYIKALEESFLFIRKYDRTFKYYFNELGLTRLREVYWFVKSFLNGNIKNYRKNILCIVPCSPPVTGTSLASETVVNHLKVSRNVFLYPYQRGDLKSGIFSLKQMIKILFIGMRILIKRMNFSRIDQIYIAVSASFWGNIRDIYLLLLLGKKNRNKTVIHLHVSYFDKYLKNANIIIKYLNRYFLSDLKKAIVLGETFLPVYKGYISQERVSIVKYFAEPELFVSDLKLRRKYKNEVLKVLYLSNMMEDKGYNLLLNAYKRLPNIYRKKIRLDFAGEFGSTGKENTFKQSIAKYRNVKYHGSVFSEKKRDILWDSHVFCLPTYYRYEAQPISIIEAYAAGCVVLASRSGGICDIMKEGVNGYFLEGISGKLESEKAISEIITNLISIYNEKKKNEYIGRNNRKEAEKYYQKERFCVEVEKALME